MHTNITMWRYKEEARAPHVTELIFRTMKGTPTNARASSINDGRGTEDGAIYPAVTSIQVVGSPGLPLRELYQSPRFKILTDSHGLL